MLEAIGFFGQQIASDKSYSRTVKTPFKITMAALDSKLRDPNGRTTLKVTHLGQDYILCNLIPNVHEQQPLDITFTTGEEIVFSIVGKNNIHLSGQYLHDNEVSSVESEEKLSNNSTDNNEEKDRMESIETATIRPENKQSKEKVLTKSKDLVHKSEKLTTENPIKDQNKSKKAAKKNKKKAKSSTPEETSNRSQGSKITNVNGVKIKEAKVGTLPGVAKPGKKLTVRYIGRLPNGEIFDKNVDGKPFRFTLGKNEVIKGWEYGIAGMRIGGERGLQIPAKLAYGHKGKPPVIPPNTPLSFEIKLIGVD